MSERPCDQCGGQGEVPTGVTQDFDTGAYEADDVERCPHCGGSGVEPDGETP